MARIEELPTEVLVLILNNLDLADIVENCSETCQRFRFISTQFFLQPELVRLASENEELRLELQDEGWTEDCQNGELIIELHEKFYYTQGRILVISGSPQNSNNQKLEVIDLFNPKLKRHLKGDFGSLEQISSRTRSVGGVLKGHPILCGGRNQKGSRQCETLQDCFDIRAQKKLSDLTLKREAAASVVLDQDTLWIVGGHDSDIDSNTSEFVRLDEPPVKGPNFPFAISCHTMVKVEENLIFVIGGIQDDCFTNKTWIVDLTNGFEINEGPTMNEARYYHSSGIMYKDGRKVILVAGGGYGLGYLSSVEVLDPYNLDEGWKFGPPLPNKLFCSVMITSPNRKGVILIGGHNHTEHEISHDLIEWQSSKSEWRILDKKLEHARSSHLAFPIPCDLITR